MMNRKRKYLLFSFVWYLLLLYYLCKALHWNHVLKLDNWSNNCSLVIYCKFSSATYCKIPNRRSCQLLKIRLYTLNMHTTKLSVWSSLWWSCAYLAQAILLTNSCNSSVCFYWGFHSMTEYTEAARKSFPWLEDYFPNNISINWKSLWCQYRLIFHCNCKLTALPVNMS